MSKLRSAKRIVTRDGIPELLRRAVSCVHQQANQKSVAVSKALCGPRSIPVEELLTPNRQDVEYRISFLEAVFEEGRPYDETLYYYFIGDTARGGDCIPEEMCEGFEALCRDIQRNGIQEPIEAMSFTSETVPCRAIFHDEKRWSEVPNETGYQIVDGAHRVAIAEFLDREVVPAYVVSPPDFEVPDYTHFIEVREPMYKRVMSEKSGYTEYPI